MIVAKLNLLNLLAEKDVTPQELQNKTGLDARTIRKMLDGNVKTLSFDVVARICTALDCGVEELIVIKKQTA
ncbi:putative transcriptional regulator [Alteribacillus persepolensis]|uniref:Putative transcriptional regulator n=1 Tax=Alteribacillus persepolensis TaxID=568899 RepID=A0A1G8I7X2_9BACI|nr:helix-turn-helix transcriptional regulator [Alteribacillus persepolensis]SDI14932.1 putative transcriptional regulator [Alteribacillus persepolensis]